MFDFKKLCGVSAICLFTMLVGGCQAMHNNTSIQEIKKDEMVTVNLYGTKNTRDLGGYKISGDKTTKSKMFFRSDNTDRLTDEDIRKLKEKSNLKNVIDLRYDSEIEAAPDKLSNIEEITYYNIPLYIPKEQMKDLINGKIDLGDAYIESLNQKEMVKNIFDTIANIDNDGSLLFHCTNGKDRTGTIAALLLGLCGVSNEDIVNNYSVTYELIKDNESVKKGIEKYGTDVIFKSLPEYMTKLMNHISEKYGNVENYLIECGISKNNIDKIKDKFTV